MTGKKAPPPIRNWKRPAYKLSLSTRIAQARAKEYQPKLIAMMSTKPKEKK